MKFTVAVAALLCSASAVATNYTNVLTAVKTISTGLETLNKSINAFQPGLDVLGAEAIQNNSNALETDIQNAVKTAKASTPFGNKGSNKVAIAFINLEQPIFSVLNNLIAKKPEFQKAFIGLVSLDSQIESSLKQQKTTSDQLGKAVAAKLSGALASSAPYIQANIDSHFAQAIKAYAN